MNGRERLALPTNTARISPVVRGIGTCRVSWSLMRSMIGWMRFSSRSNRVPITLVTNVISMSPLLGRARARRCTQPPARARFGDHEEKPKIGRLLLEALRD